MATDLNTFINRLPKCELHVHLEGCLTPILAKQIASRNNLPLPDSISQASHDSSHPFKDLTTFLTVYPRLTAVLQTRQDFHDLAWHYLVRAQAQNVRRVELSFSPQAHAGHGVSFDTVLDGYWDAVVEAKVQLGISAGLVLCILRDHDLQSATKTLESGLKQGNRERILGLGLDGDEQNNPPVRFKDLFARARSEGKGWKLTMHCNIDQPNALVHIRQALHVVKVDRIDHGINIVDDPELISFTRHHNIGLTCCSLPSSVLTPSSKSNEILALLRQGVRVTTNSDDSAYFRGYIAENLLKIASETDVTLSELVQFERNAFKVAWISDEERKALISELDKFTEEMLPRTSLEQ